MKEPKYAIRCTSEACGRCIIAYYDSHFIGILPVMYCTACAEKEWNK